MLPTPRSSRVDPTVQDPFFGGGAMGAAMAAMDWSATPLGPAARWPQNLRTTVALCLASRAPMMVVWGPQHIQLYNDALAPLMGAKHPDALGRPYAESFPEIWEEVMAPLLTAVYQGEATYLEDVPVSFHREVPDEEMFWTFSWSPLRDERGVVVGALHPAVETTARVLAERRLRLLADLATTSGQAVTVREACERAVAVLAEHPLDAPCAAMYVLEDASGAAVPPAAQLIAASGVRDVAAVFPAQVFPAQVDPAGGGPTGWPLAAAARSGRLETTTGLDVDPARLRGCPWPEGVTDGLVLPLSRADRSRPVALLALGLNPHRLLDQANRDFLQLLASQLATALTTAALHEQQHRAALTLQRSLLPDTSRASATLDIAVRYQPGSAEAEVGGDWYDVIPTGSGRTALVVGDVMGRGVPAAAVMGQLRAAVRAYTQLDLPPQLVLDLLDQLVEQVSGTQDVGQIVTCIYAVHDADHATLTVANAGHLPPVLLGTEDCRLLEIPAGPPLGTGYGRHTSHQVEFPRGASLLLYTDGLVERRDSDLDAGTDRLLGAIRAAGLDGAGDLERLADVALSVQGHDERDDVALLAVRLTPATASAGCTARPPLGCGSRP